MNVLFLTQVYPNSKNPGVAIFLKQLVDSFKSNDVQIAVLKLRNFQNLFSRDYEFDEVRSFSFLSLGDRFLRHFTLLNYIVSAVFYICFCKKKPDIIYAKFLYFSGGASYVIHKLFGIPYFIDIGESNIFYYRNKVDIFLMKIFLKGANGIICVSEKLKLQIIDFGISENNILLSHNTVDSTKFIQIDSVVAREELGLDPGDFIIVFVGHFNTRKGPHRLLEAVELGDLPANVKLVFLGMGDILLDSSRILFKGEVNTKNLVLWLNSANLFALPTLAEGNCNAINEALSVGLPIICSDIKELHEQIPFSHATYFDPYDTKSIQNAILSNYSNSIIRNKSVVFNKDRNSIILKWVKSKLK